MPQITIAENRVWTSAEKEKCAPTRTIIYYISLNEKLAFWTFDIDVVQIALSESPVHQAGTFSIG